MKSLYKGMGKEMRALEVVVVMVMVTQAAAVEVTMGQAEGPSMVLLIPRR